MQTSKSILLFFISFFLMSVFNTAYAGEVTVFGPKQYIRTTGAPDIYTDAFSADPGEARVVIRNGESDKSQKNTRVRSGIVNLNGVELFGHNDFKQQAYFLERSVVLQENNLLQIELESTPNTFLYVEIVRETDLILPSGTFTADPATLSVGNSTTLSWTSSHATSCTIEPDIGTVALNGSMTITPTQTTEYTLTMVGPGGTSTEQVTINVIPATPPPVINLLTDDDIILLGASTTLSWTSEYADALTIEPDLGAVAFTGSTIISPEVTTTYIATATGSGGTSTQQVVVTVLSPEPLAALSAAPTSIASGESSTLTWSTQYAQTCTIEPGIGTVPCTGELTVTPVQETTYLLTASGQGGSTTAQVTVAVMTATDPLSLIITSPSDGESISRPDVSVTGTIHHRDGLETGVLINGVTALVYDGQFVADHVPLIDGENTITVRAVDVNGEYVEKTLTVTRESFSKSVELQTDIKSGLAPLETVLRFDANFTTADPLNLTYNSSGEVHLTNGTEEDTWNISITEPGIYTFTGELQDADGTTYRDQASVQVYDRATLDTLLQGKWNGMKEALATDDIEGGLQYMLERSRERYGQAFNELTAQLPTIIADMNEISMVYYDDGIAKYRINRIHDINGKSVTITYYIYFRKDYDGLFKIYKF